MLQRRIVPSIWLPGLPNILQVLLELPPHVLSQLRERVPAVRANRKTVTVKTVMASRFLFIRAGWAATTPGCLVLLQTMIAYIQALGIHSLSNTMPLKPLAAKAFVFNRNLVDYVASSGTRLHRRRILHRFFQNAGLLLW